MRPTTIVLRLPAPLLSAIALAIATTFVWSTVAVGWWWATLLIAVASGLTIAPRLSCWTIGLGGGILGWGLPLAWMAALGAPVARASTDLSSLMGYSFGALAVVVTVVVGAALSACGVWLGRAGRAGRAYLRVAVISDDTLAHDAADEGTE